ncbi:MAG TPA: TIGR02757 family protein [Actinobacteria bacterium]|nr:TIGR02757 family protein [Actinomycetota bacterium]
MKRKLDELYSRYNNRRFVHPDPLELLYSYSRIEDREIAGLIASSLAYGRVTQILKSAGQILKILGPSPRRYLMGSELDHLKQSLAGFKHRFTTGDEVACLLYAVRKMIKDFGSLNNAFLAGYKKEDPDMSSALLEFCKNISIISNGSCCSLIPSHLGGSAFKRLNLYLRWMVRNDEVDPGGWSGLPTSKLLIPLDTHMHRISRSLGLTLRKQADMKTVVEVTESFKLIEKNDPVRYDFALTRAGINRLQGEF